MKAKTEKKSCIHIYCGDGKGKTTAAMGLALRAAGSGKRVVLTQFLKDGSSSELKILREIPQIQVFLCEEKFGFFWNMSEEQKETAKRSYTELFERAMEAAKKGAFLLVMDELIAAYNHELVERERVLHFLWEKPEDLEVVMTGREPAPELLDLADYVSEIQKRKHPFDQGIPARKGIEL